jgi:hypothetical protein
LQQEINDYPELEAINYWQAAPAASRRNAQPTR